MQGLQLCVRFVSDERGFFGGIGRRRDLERHVWLVSGCVFLAFAEISLAYEILYGVLEIEFM